MELFHRDPQHWREIMLRERHHEDELSIVLGLDFGGTGIKGAPVDVATGTLLLERYRIPTPNPATPQAVADVIRQIKEHFRWDGPIGIGVPSVVRRGIVRSAANIDKSWININAVDLVQRATGCHVAAINDADAAGFAEMRFGAGRPLQREGTVLMTTFGTGIGTALFVGGHLVPNLEMGHIEVNGEIAEKVASGAVKEKTDMSWKKWAGRVNEYLARMEHYLQPDLIVIGGGISKKDEKFLHLLSVPGGIVAAEMRNEAGIVGAAFMHLLSVPGGTPIVAAEMTRERLLTFPSCPPSPPQFLHLLSVPGGTPIVAAEMRNEAGIVGAAVGGSILLGEQRAAREAARLTPTLLS
ncbi:unnamed protein product [Closterium sp. Naga37s-1]|nr:unnamed protein product [Closterium sp. Naga37s-1]